LGVVEVALDGGRGAAAAGAEVDEDVGGVGVAEVGAEEAGDDLGGGGGLEEGDLGGGEYLLVIHVCGGEGWRRTLVVQAAVSPAWTYARRKLGNLVRVLERCWLVLGR
jgi:hypothetical protein